MHNLVALVTLASLLLFYYMMFLVGRARMKLGVSAPAVTGHPEFERCFRVQANTLEGLIVFLPSLWLCAIALDRSCGGALGDELSAGLGVLWIIGRIIYMRSYIRDPASRSLGFGVQFVATAILLVSALISAIWGLSQGVL